MNARVKGQKLFIKTTYTDRLLFSGNPPRLSMTLSARDKPVSDSKFIAGKYDN